jgi:hypothetical protein
VAEELADLPTREPLVTWSPADHPLAPKLPKAFINPRWQRYLSDSRDESVLKPTRRAIARYVNQAGAIGVTPLPIGIPNAGLWRISYYVRITTPGTISSSLEVTFLWDDEGVTVPLTGAAIVGNTITTVQFGTLPIDVDADTPISVSTTYASAGATPMQYKLTITAEDVARLDAA